MPFLNGVYDKLNVIVDGEVRGLTLAPGHYALLRALHEQREPKPIESFVIEGPDNRWLSPVDVVKAGNATLGEPFAEAPAICTIGDADLPIDMVVEMVRAGTRGR